MNAILTKMHIDHVKTASTKVFDLRQRILASKTMRFLLHFLEMSLAMGSGMALFYLVLLLIRASSSYGAMFEPGTDLYAIGMAVFMTVPTWLASQCGNGGRIARSNSC